LSVPAVTRNGYTLDAGISTFSALIVGILFLEMIIISKQHSKGITNKSWFSVLKQKLNPLKIRQLCVSE
jgi:hypothetical protein